MKSENKGRDIFFGVVALATLIVAIVGATLAYFSVTASSNEGAVNAKAATVSIEYNDGQQVTAQADKLIPADLSVVQSVYERKVKPLLSGTDISEIGNACLDDKDMQVCSSYRFTISSGTDRTITATLNNEHNGFTYLSYAVYNVTKGQWMVLNDDGDLSLSLNSCSNQNNEGDDANLNDDCFKLDTKTNQKTYSSTTPNAVNSIFGLTESDGKTVKREEKLIANEVQEYDLVIFIQNADFDQNIDQGQEYFGTIIVDVLDGGVGGNGQISGYVDPKNQ